MKTDIEKFFSVLFQLLGEFREHMGALAGIALGVILALWITFSILVLHWIHRGGLAPGFSHRFFAERRETESWLKRR